MDGTSAEDNSVSSRGFVLREARSFFSLFDGGRVAILGDIATRFEGVKGATSRAGNSSFGGVARTASRTASASGAGISTRVLSTDNSGFAVVNDSRDTVLGVAPARSRFEGSASAWVTYSTSPGVDRATLSDVAPCFAMNLLSEGVHGFLHGGVLEQVQAASVGGGPGGNVAGAVGSHCKKKELVL